METVIASEIGKSQKNVILPKTEKKDKVAKSKEIAKDVIASKVGRETIYIYPKDVKGISKKEKSFRTKLRNTLERYVDSTLLGIKTKKKDYDFTETYNAFVLFYKGNYRINDFSVSSLRETISDVQKEDLETFLGMCKKHVSKA